MFKTAVGDLLYLRYANGCLVFLIKAEIVVKNQKTVCCPQRRSKAGARMQTNALLAQMRSLYNKCFSLKVQTFIYTRRTMKFTEAFVRISALQKARLFLWPEAPARPLSEPVV